MSARPRRTAPTLATALSLAMLALAGWPAAGAERGEAIFAGGCFWCMEASLEGVPGVRSVISGYTGGTRKNPSYEEVSSGGTGHAESVRVLFDPARLSYARLLELFWHNVDPLSSGGQFCDRGSQYRSAIFVLDDAQKRAAEDSKRAVEAQLGQKVATEIVRAGEFYPAEEYHQDYYKKNAAHYHAYREGCGRDRRLQEIWGAHAGR